jgi:hypothetical protein
MIDFLAEFRRAGESVQTAAISGNWRRNVAVRRDRDRKEDGRRDESVAGRFEDRISTLEAGMARLTLSGATMRIAEVRWSKPPVKRSRYEV